MADQSPSFVHVWYRDNQEVLPNVLLVSPPDAAETQCLRESANDVFTCYPNDSTVVAQHEWTTIVCA